MNIRSKKLLLKRRSFKTFNLKQIEQETQQDSFFVIDLEKRKRGRPKKVDNTPKKGIVTHRLLNESADDRVAITTQLKLKAVSRFRQLYLVEEIALKQSLNMISSELSIQYSQIHKLLESEF